MQTGMRVNWWGLMGERFARRFGRISTSEEVSGIPGSDANHHGAPYAMTEEFVAVYRMHPLIPDDFSFRAHRRQSAPSRTGTSPRSPGIHTHEVLEAVSMPDLFYSFGTSHPGAIVLHNYPKFLQRFEKPDGSLVDLAATDILRSRERGVPRYNEFRRKFHLAPADTFEASATTRPWWPSSGPSTGDPEEVDLMIGLYAEKPPAGFAFSDTAFRVFILMASRRLKSDRFFTYDYRPEVYTQEGLALDRRQHHEDGPAPPLSRLGASAPPVAPTPSRHGPSATGRDQTRGGSVMPVTADADAGHDAATSSTTCSDRARRDQIPKGEARGTVISHPGTEFAEIAAKLVHLIAWQGKVFDPEKGELLNEISPLHLDRIRAKVYNDASWFDSKDCIVLDYSKTSLVAHWIRDEMRQVSPGVYLGIVYWDKTRILNFALEFPQS